VPVGPAKFDINQCNESPLWGEKPDFWPVSKFNTDSLPLCGILPVTSKSKQLNVIKSKALKNGSHRISDQPASVAQWAEAQCAPTGMVCWRGGVQSPGRPVDFVFGFQGRML